MDALSIPVTAAARGGSSTSLLHLPSSLRPSSSLPLPHPPATHLSFHSKPQSIHPRSTTESHLHHAAPAVPKPNHALAQSSAKFHHRAATGYAAALADAACRAGTLAAADLDARRLVRHVRGVIGDPTVKESEKVQMVMKLIQSGDYEKHVVTLIKLLARKGKLNMLNEVMAEFSRICDELSGTKVVVVGPTRSRGNTTEFERIAKQVQKTSGASRVKVRHFISI